jgi:hypothetical protein
MKRTYIYKNKFNKDNLEKQDNFSQIEAIANIPLLAKNILF